MGLKVIKFIGGEKNFIFFFVFLDDLVVVLEVEFLLKENKVFSFLFCKGSVFIS